MSEKHLKLHERFNKLTPQKKLLVILAILFSLVFLFIFVTFLVGKFFIWISIEQLDRSPFYYGLHEFLSLTLTVYCFVAFAIVYKLYTGRRNTITDTDDRGVKYMARGTHGTARFALDEEIEEKFNITDISETNEMIYGQLTKDGGGADTISYKGKSYGGEGNRSTLVCATSGAGKSYGEVSGNIIKCVERGHSLAIVDPSGELYSRLGQFCRNSKYDVKLLNLKNLDYSDYWNCIWETIDEKTGRLESSRLRSFANIFMRNSAEVKGQDFWYECAQNLIEATIGLIAVRREKYILDKYLRIYEKITGEIGSYFEERITNTFVSFPWCEEQIRKAVRDRWLNIKDIEFDTVDKVDAIMEQIKESAPKFNIEEVYNTINIVGSKKIEAEFALLPKYHPAKAAYDRYVGVRDKDKKNADAVTKGAIQGAQLKFKIFDDHKLRQILSNDGINFNTINKTQSAYFVAIPDTDDSYTPIASLFFSFFFKDVQENYDYEESLRIKEKRENKCIPVMAMLDEFASLGVLTGSEKLFSTYMSDMRKRKIYAWIVIQYYSQLEGIYGRYAKDGILSNCATTLYLGGNDPNTLEWISEKSGTSTAMMESHQQVDTFIKRYEEEAIRVQESKRNLLNTDEAGMVEDKVLILKQGCHPFFVETLPWTDAPEFEQGLCEEHSYFENIDNLEERMEEMYEKSRLKEDPETDIQKAIDSLTNDEAPEHQEITKEPEVYTCKIALYGAYEYRDIVKKMNYKYDKDTKSWWKLMQSDELEDEVAVLQDEVKMDPSNIEVTRVEEEQKPVQDNQSNTKKPKANANAKVDNMSQKMSDNTSELGMDD